MKNNTFSADHKDKLLGTIGATFLYVAGENLGPNLLSDVLILATSKQELRVQGDINEQDFDGYWDTYSFIDVSIAEPRSVDLAKASGNLYKKFAGQEILDVLIVSDEIRSSSKVSESWVYETDSAIVFVLEHGVVVLTKVSLHNEVLRVSYGEVFTIGEIPTTSYYFEDTLEVTYTTERKWRSLLAE